MSQPTETIELFIDRVAVKFEEYWRESSLTSAIAELPPDTKPEVFEELFVMEFELRFKNGFNVVLNNYTAKYPQHAVLLSQVYESVMQKRTVGDYEYYEMLDEGGMGQVFRAEQKRLGKEVVLKRIKSSMLQKQQITERFEKEMKLCGQLRHKNIVHTDNALYVDGVHYIIQEFIKGKTVQAIIESRGAMPLGAACEILRQCAEGMKYAFEEKKIIHRDLKPSNLMLTYGGAAKIIDFGLGTFADSGTEDSSPKLTQYGTVLGTVDYAAPEQLNNPIDAVFQSDIYSLGCIFYFLLTGIPPRNSDSESRQRCFAARIRGELPELPKHIIRNELYAVQTDIIHFYKKCTDKEIKKRYDSYGEIIKRLKQYASEETLLKYLQNSDSSAEPSKHSSIRNKFLLRRSILGVSALTALAASGTVYLNRGQVKKQTNPQSPVPVSFSVPDLTKTVKQELQNTLETLSAKMSNALETRYNGDFNNAQIQYQEIISIGEQALKSLPKEENNAELKYLLSAAYEGLEDCTLFSPRAFQQYFDEFPKQNGNIKVDNYKQALSYSDGKEAKTRIECKLFLREGEYGHRQNPLSAENNGSILFRLSESVQRGAAELQSFLDSFRNITDLNKRCSSELLDVQLFALRKLLVDEDIPDKLTFILRYFEPLRNHLNSDLRKRPLLLPYYDLSIRAVKGIDVLYTAELIRDVRLLPQTETLAQKSEQPILQFYFPLDNGSGFVVLSRADFSSHSLFPLGWNRSDIFESFNAGKDLELPENLTAVLLPIKDNVDISWDDNICFPVSQQDECLTAQRCPYKLLRAIEKERGTLK
jgi:serine/threonine protein kinase